MCYTSGTLKICPNLKLTAQLAYIVIDADCDCRRYFNVLITFSNISMMHPIVLISIMGLYSHQHGVCFKVFIANDGKEFRQLVSNCVFYIRKYYNNFIYIIDRRSLYRIEHTILNTCPKYLPIGL